jgi:hypothetical protein
MNRNRKLAAMYIANKVAVKHKPKPKIQKASE